MFDKLIDVLVDVWDKASPIEVLRVYERGVRLRGGAYKETLEPGVYFKIPFYDSILIDNVVTRTHNLSPQALCTADGRSVQVSAVMRFSIRDVKKALLDVESVDHATRDIGYLVIADAVQRSTYEEVRSNEFADVLTKAARKRGWRYGIEVEELGLSDISPSKTLVLVRPNG